MIKMSKVKYYNFHRLQSSRIYRDLDSKLEKVYITNVKVINCLLVIISQLLLRLPFLLILNESIIKRAKIWKYRWESKYS